MRTILIASDFTLDEQYCPLLSSTSEPGRHRIRLVQCVGSVLIFNSWLRWTLVEVYWKVLVVPSFGSGGCESSGHRHTGGTYKGRKGHTRQ